MMALFTFNLRRALASLVLALFLAQAPMAWMHWVSHARAERPLAPGPGYAAALEHDEDGCALCRGLAAAAPIALSIQAPFILPALSGFAIIKCDAWCPAAFAGLASQRGPPRS